jgi:hypothetical protein
MRNARRAALATLLATVVAPAAAPARIIELGVTEQAPVPSCPDDPCLAVSRTTGYQGKIDGEDNIFQVPRDGRIVAWTVVLGDPNTKQLKFFDTTLGGEPSAGITVFQPGKHYAATIVAESPIMKLTDYLGERVQFPLAHSIPVVKKQRVALTVPTWAPALAVLDRSGGKLPRSTSWRASRSKEQCDDTATQTAQTSVGATTTFGCRYTTARLTYKVTIVTNPHGPPKEKKKKKPKR